VARPRKPTQKKLLKGTAQACRLNPDEPDPERGTPDPPEHLSERARKAWPGVAKLLAGMGVLTVADGMVLEGLCETYAELVEARLALRARGAMSYCTEPDVPVEAEDEEKKGSSTMDELVEQAIAAAERDMADVETRFEPQPHGGALKRQKDRRPRKVMWRMYPEVGIIAELDRRFAMWLSRVGLTPADRSRVSSASGANETGDPWDEF
jgi:P27 family predicted phage terminase small subunit